MAEITITTVRVHSSLIPRLERYKVHRRETAEEVIERALDALEREQERERERTGRKLRQVPA